MDRSRFARLLSEQALDGKEVMVVGCGGIGSNVALFLAKMGVQKFVLVDPDHVEEENIATQAFGRRYLGWWKVDATEDIILDVNPDTAVEAHASRMEALVGLPDVDVVVLALDSLAARLSCYHRLFPWATKQSPRGDRLLVDPRMGLESLDVQFVRAPFEALKEGTEIEHFERWEKGLRDTDAVELPCGAKAIAYNGAFAGAVVAAQVRRWLMGKKVPSTITAHIGAAGMEAAWLAGEKYEKDVY